MPPRERNPDVIRLVEGVHGKVAMRMQLVIRFDYGSIVPWVRSIGDRLEVCGRAACPHDLVRSSDARRRHEDRRRIRSARRAERGFRHALASVARSGWRAVRHPNAIDCTDRWWREWSARSTYRGEWGEAVQRSLITLKALTYAPTGGILAAPTTSLPEMPGSVRNWDYRYCWLRDATFTLYALLLAGYKDEACAWRDWLLRAIAGDPSKLQIMYGTSGERRLEEYEIPWLPGFENSRPVRVGNAAHEQFQLDVYGEVIDSLHQARVAGIDPDEPSWRLQKAILNYLESAWSEPDMGIWEVRGPARHFTHSKVMAWVAFDRAIKAIENFGLKGPCDRWKAQRQQIREEILAKGFHPKIGAFTQEYGSDRLDASLLMVPLVGFLPPEDERVQGTVRAIERDLLVDGFVLRYEPEKSAHVDGLPPGEGAFLPCTFWLADNYALAGRTDEARAIFERLLAIRNDVGLLAEEYDPRTYRQLGNFPQAFTHVGLVNTARNLANHGGPAHQRKDCS